eukprot:scaffold1433_cov132-Skeletonema_menzelii.AAC.6
MVTGNGHLNGGAASPSAVDQTVADAIAAADIYRSCGTTYLHIDNPLTTNSSAVMNHDANPTGAVVPPISLATTFRQNTPGEPMARSDPNSWGMGYEYSRTGNPTRGVFERAVAAAEKTKYCVAFSSGSAATSAVIHLLSPGEKVLSIDDVYGGTQRYFRKVVNPRMGIDVDFVDFGNEDEVQSKLKSGDGKIKLFWLETPTNPTLKNPAELGADLVVHSVTKYINGHSDVVMGVVCTNDEDIYKQLRFTQNGVGAIPSPFDCFLALRGLKTLHLRMEAAARNANAIALFLEKHDCVSKVVYPGLKSHPQHEIATRQQNGYGAMITFYCIGGREQAAKILQNLRVFALAESLGAIESLAESPSLMTHASVPDEQRKLLRIDDTLIRLSVGVESCVDLILDLDSALNAALSSVAVK